MKLSEFKQLLEAKNNTKTKLPTSNKEIGILIKESIESIAMDVIPIDLVTEDLSLPTFRWLDAKKHIRQAVIPLNDNDKIDIDEELVYAVVYDFLANHLSDLTLISFYSKKKEEVINKYMWNSYVLLEGLKN